MNRSERRALQRLPRALHAWEIAWMPTPVTIDGTDIEALLVVVEAVTGHVRGAGPLLRDDSAWPVLEGAFTDPTDPCSPARPPHMRVADPELKRRLERDLKGTGVRVKLVDQVDTAEQAIRSLGEHLSPQVAPGIDVELPRWSEALERFAQAAPWRYLPDTHVFRLQGIDELQDAVAVVLGLGGEQRGLVVYPSLEDLHHMERASMLGDMEALAAAESMNLFLDGADEMSPADIRACQDVGLVTSDGLYPLVAVLAGGAPAPASPVAQQWLLAYVEGIASLAEAHGQVLLHEPKVTFVMTPQGKVAVLSLPSELPPEVLEPTFLDGYDFAMAIGAERVDEERRVVDLYVKLRKRDAQRLIRRFVGLTGVRVVTGAGSVSLHLVVGGERGVDVGALLRLRSDVDAVKRLANAEVIRLWVAAGGPKRPRIRDKDVLWERSLEVLSDR